MGKLATSFAAAVGWPLLVVLVVSAAPRLAAAQGKQPAIDWKAPTGCPDAATFAAQVARYLGNSAAGAGVRVEVEVASDKHGFHLIWRMHGPAGASERTLDGTDCALLAETAALTLALAIDPSAEEGVDEARIFGVDDDELPPGRIEAVVPFAEIRKPRRAGPRLGVAMRLTTSGDIGRLPGLAPSVGGTMAATSAPYRVELGFSYWPSRRHQVADNPSTGGDFNMWAGAFRACDNVVERFGTWSACLGVEAGKIAGSGFGVDVPESNSSTWVAGTGAVAGSWKLVNHLFLRADLEIAIPKDRPRFVLSGVLVHQPSAFTARLVTGLELQFR